MKKLLTAFFFTYAMVFFSCTEKGNEPSSSKAQLEIPSQQKPDSSIYISYFTSFQFRRTFADAQFMKDDKEIERYYREQEKANPGLVWGKYDTPMLKQLEKFGIVKNDELFENKFKTIKNNSFELDDVSGKKLFISFKTDYPKGYGTKVTAKDSCQIFFFPTDQINYLVKDLIPGENPEIIVVEEHYFMLGYIYYVTVYEICYK